jgi:hypothetical protein
MSFDHDVIPLERVERAFRSARFSVTNVPMATEFLQSRDFSKCNVDRFVAWLIILNGIPPDPELWPQTLYYIIRSYRGKLSYYIKRPDDLRIPNCLPSQISDAIKSDVARAITLFSVYAEAIGIPRDFWVDAELRISRFTIISIFESPQYDYLQGYDRFALISYILAIGFANRLKFSLIEAEAFAIVLFRRVIALSDAHQFLKSDSATRDHFSSIDAFLRVLAKDVMTTISQTNESSVGFASGWAGLLFSGNHRPLDVLMIWDQFVLHHDYSVLFFKAMAAAHLVQVPRARSSFQQLEAIQQFEGWDMAKLLNDAERFYNESSGGQPAERKHILCMLTSWFF